MALRRAELSAPRCTLLDVALIGLFVPVAKFLTHTPADPDLWGHLRFGSDLVAARSLQVRDLYSFTADRTWINHEWLSEIVTALLYQSAGALGLNLLKLLVIGTVAVMVWRVARKEGGGFFSAGLLTTLVLLATGPRTQVVRPQLFSVLFFCVLLSTLVRIESGKREPWLLLPSLFCLWANMHGGWIVGFGTFALWTAFEVAETRPLDDRLRRVAILIAALAATLINPHGIGLWRFLYETVGLSRPDIAEWRPLLALQKGVIAVQLVLPIVALAAAVSQRRWPSWRHAAILVMLGFSMFRVSRVDAFFQLAVVYLTAPVTVGWLAARETARAHRSSRLSRPSYVHGAAAAGLLLTTAAVSVAAINKIYVEGDWKPDADGARFLLQTSPNTRVLTWFDWGEYAIWHLSPAGIHVSMDGRRETVYSERVLHDHLDFYDNVGEGWRYPTTIGAERIWLPKRLAIVPVLQKRGWHIIYQNSRSVVFAPDTDWKPAPVSVTASSDSGRATLLFPGL